KSVYETRVYSDIHYDNGLPDEISTVIATSYLYSLYAAGIFIFLTTTMNFFNVNNVINTNKKITRCLSLPTID
ncbi:hypothetical protein, partial [Yersinia pekkanenii]